MTRTIIDVREPIEFRAGHVKGAINIPPRKLLAGAGELNDIPKSTELIFIVAPAIVQLLQSIF